MRKNQGNQSKTKKSPKLLTEKISVFFLSKWYKFRMRQVNFLSRRPHRSFKRTYRRDYRRSLKLPGYIAFTHHVNKTLRKHWRIFVLLAIIQSLLMIMVGVITSKETYETIASLISESVGDFADGGVAKISQVGLLVLSSLTIDPSTLNPSQMLYIGIFMLMTWLTAVWLLRELLAGRKPKLRDGLYNAGSPILSTLGVIAVLFTQLLPVGIMSLIYAALSAVDFLESGFGGMIFSVLVAVVVSLVLYWASSTMIALVVVTLPGMYPMQAIKAAGDLVIGRRLRIMYRLIWALFLVVLTWFAIMISYVMLEKWVTSLAGWMKDIALAPFVGAFVASGIVVWFAAYVYLLYRRIVEDDAKPA